MGTKKPSDPFLLRAIEHWLDSVNELTYQPIFCELLIYKGYALKYSIKNTQLEFGKDVVAVASDGVPWAFQLKGGNINTTRWRHEVKVEIEPLIELSIQHPSIDKLKTHVSVLVTNGEIEDPVRIEIASYNESKWKDSPLQVWTRGDLLKGFLELSSGIFPKDAGMYKLTTDLMFANPSGFPNTKYLYEFLFRMLNINNDTIKLAQRKRDITTSYLYVNIFVVGYRKINNHYSTIQSLVILLSLVLHLRDKYNLKDNYWLISYLLIWKDIVSTSQLLELEINNGVLSNLYSDVYDNELIPFRIHSAISLLFTMKLSQLISKDESYKSIYTNLDTYKKTMTIWGEAALLPGIYLGLMLSKNSDLVEDGMKMLRDCVVFILKFNGRNSQLKTGLLPPVYNVNYVVDSLMGQINHTNNLNYKLSSSYLKCLLDILVRIGDKEFLSDMWLEISFMHFEEFIPDNPIDYFLLHSEHGINQTELPKREQSWSELVDRANYSFIELLPPSIKRFPEFLPYLLFLAPYRANSITFGFLHQSITKIKDHGKF